MVFLEKYQKRNLLIKNLNYIILQETYRVKIVLFY